MQNIPIPYSSLRNNKRIDLVEQIPLAKPFTIYLEVTNICNFKCIFCPESFDNYKEKSGGHFQMTMEEFTNIVQQIKQLGGVKTLNLYMMGEPFVNKNLTNFIALAKKEGIAERIIVTSNGTLIKSDKYQAICESGLDYLRISIYGANEDYHKLNTQSHISLEKIKENIIGLKEFRNNLGLSHPHIYVKMIESKDELQNMDFINLFENVGDEIKLEPVMNWNDPEEGNLSGFGKSELLDASYFSLKKQACPFPFYTLVIHSDLNVSVCCVDWDKQAVVGNLRNESLKEIWYGEKLNNFQIKHLQHKKHELNGCKNCTYLHTAPDNIDKLSPDEFIRRRNQ